MHKELRCYVKHDMVYSTLVYPLDKGYVYKAQLDREWVKERLSAVFGGDVRDIANKYVVDIEGILVTNHDGNYYLTEKK
jgi:hypothetical protein